MNEQINKKVVDTVTEKLLGNYVELPTRVQKAKQAKWPLIKADVTVFISDPSVSERDRNIKVSCMVPPDELDAAIHTEIAKILAQSNYDHPVVESVSIETSGHAEDGSEIHGGGYGKSILAPL